MHRNRLLTALTGLALAGTAPLLDPSAAQAATTQHVVTTTADVVDAGDGLLSLREAVSLSNADPAESEIVLAPGADYHLTICGGADPEHDNVYGDIDFEPSSASVTITGNGATIDQDCADERVLLTERPIVVRDLTLTGATNNSDPCCKESNGGGIFAYSDVIAEDTTFTGLNSSGGGAVVSGGDITLTRVSVVGNTAVSGTPTVSGIGPASVVTVVDSTISGNTSNTGVFRSNHQLVVRNSTITGNTVPGLNVHKTLVRSNGSLELDHVTIADNVQQDGDTVSAGGDLELRASVLDNEQEECVADGTITSLGGNVVEDTTCGTPTATDQTGVVDPGLGNLADNGGATATLLPETTSPARDAVPPAECSATTTTDQRGLPRPSGAGCDAGAVELQVRSDLSVRRGQQPFVGDGVQNLTATGQTTSARAARGGSPRFAVRLENDGEVPGDLVVRGNRGRGSVTARYFLAGAEVTDEVLAGLPLDLDPGESTLLGIRVRVGNAAPHGLVRRFTVGVRPAGGDPVDRVRAEVQVS